MTSVKSVLLFLVGLAYASGHHCKIDLETACKLGGDVQISSQPGSLPVNKDNCDPLYPKQEFAKEPRFSYKEAKKDAVYTVVMIDPDAPKHEKGEYYLHWIVANLRGEDLAEGHLEKGATLTPYKGPGPPEGTGIHRYMFVILDQNKEAKLDTPVGDEKRRKWVLTEWINEQHHNVKCEPVAGTQFRAQFK